MDSNGSSSNDIYRMTSVPRGFCVIINIVNFNEDSERLERVNSYDNITAIKNTFEQLKFKIKILTDVTEVEIKEKLRGIYIESECDSHDCFIVYIHSHGVKLGFLTTNNRVIEYGEIIKMFSNAKCPKFANKPKILFFDCCRGGKLYI